MGRIRLNLARFRPTVQKRPFRDQVAMPLTKLQLQALRFYAAHRDRAPTLGEMMQLLALTFFVRMVVGAVAAVACDILRMPMVGFLACGILLGAMLRDTGVSMRSVQLWPLVGSVLDWDRVDQLLAESERL
jgi:hypothetical protein